MIEQLLPAVARAVETFDYRRDVALFPQEAAAISRAVDKRRREFITVRACARDALVQLGVPPAPLLPGERGEPSWPDGVVGSMTHCEGYSGAAVARSADLASIGIDAEPDAPLPEGVFDLISVAADLPGMTDVARQGVAADRLLFSAKESVYKAWFPLARRWLGFDDAAVRLRTDGTFSARLSTHSVVVNGQTLVGFEGRWIAAHGLVATAVTVPY